MSMSSSMRLSPRGRGLQLRFDEANWERLAELASEPVDMQAWQAWAREGCKLRRGGKVL